MSTTLQTYKTVGGVAVEVPTPEPTGAAGKWISDTVKALTDVAEATLAGTRGADGATITIGTAVSGTSDTTATVAGSKAGDLYINSTTFGLFKATAANTWSYVGTLKGATGDPGTNGTNGTDGVSAGWTKVEDTASTTCSAAMSTGNWYLFGNSAVSSLALTSSLTFGQSAAVEFASPATATTFTAPASSRHFGDGCDTDFDFTPEASKRYLITYTVTGGGLCGFVKEIG